MDDFERVAFTLRVLRREGVAFGDAWRVAFPRPRPSAARVDLRVALDATAEAWRRSYEREPALRSEVAARLLVGLLAEGDAIEDATAEHVAVRCG